MASTKDKVQTALSEVRTLVLGAQILLGFQYQAVFRPRFEELPGHTKAFKSVAFALMMVTVGCLIAPSSFHRISEGGEATRRQLAYTKGMITSVLVPFVLAIGAICSSLPRPISALRPRWCLAYLQRQSRLSFGLGSNACSAGNDACTYQASRATKVCP